MDTINIILLIFAIVIVFLLITILALIIVKSRSLKSNSNSELSDRSILFINDKFNETKEAIGNKISLLEKYLIKELSDNNA